MKTSFFSDEILMAYADGQLDELRSAKIRHACADDARILARVEMFRTSRQLLQQVAEQFIEEPVPQQLMCRVQALSDAPIVGNRDLRQTAPRFGRRWQRLRIPAALTAMLVAFVAGWSVNAPVIHRAGTDGILAMTAALPPGIINALDHVTSGDAVRIRVANAEIDVLLLGSYESGGRYCREFEVTGTQDAHAGSAHGLACREKGMWTTHMIANRASAATVDDAYTPAAGDRDLTSLLGTSRALSPDEERRLLENDWQHP
jgi:hypothetical protein